MSLVKWSLNLSVNIEEMDKQHQGLLDVMNRLHDSISAGKGSDGPKLVIAELVDYTKEHFSAEEQLMQRFRFPQLGLHKAEHAKFTEIVVDLQKRISDGQAVSAYEVLQFLRQWLIAHIQESDAKYGKHIGQIMQKISIKT